MANEIARTAAEIIAEVEMRPEVHSAKLWESGAVKRVYVNIVGRDNAKAGDRNAKVYWDSKRQRWLIDGLKGNMSSEFARNIRSFARVYCPSAFWNV